MSPIAYRGAVRCFVLLSLILLAPLSGCVYRMTVQQGNFLERRAVDQLQLGMTRSQVRYLLGTPMVPDMFNTDRWDYLYYLHLSGNHKPEQHLLTVFFDNDKVARIDNHGQAVRDSAPVTVEPPPRPVS
ncbi:MAG TPA: outer membrane protein assembly factor BamE [Steroidobacteraceae bacterium]|nr:outer membrane protein assembly factor BamE [Steroidobacteraceae bacterium]